MHASCGRFRPFRRKQLSAVAGFVLRPHPRNVARREDIDTGTKPQPSFAIPWRANGVLAVGGKGLAYALDRHEIEPGPAPTGPAQHGIVFAQTPENRGLLLRCHGIGHADISRGTPASSA